MGRKGKKKPTSQNQGDASGSSSGAPPDPRALTAGAGEKKEELPKTTGGDQSVSKGDAKGFQKREQYKEGRYQSNQGWEKPGSSQPERETDSRRYQQKRDEDVTKYEPHRYQQRGDRREQHQGPSKEQHEYNRGQQHRGYGQPQRQNEDEQWSGREQPESIGRGQRGYEGGQQWTSGQWHNREQQQSTGRGQRGHYGGEQWPRKHQQRGDSGQTERQYQPGGSQDEGRQWHNREQQQSVGRGQRGHSGGQQWPRKHQQRGYSGQTERQYEPRGSQDEGGQWHNREQQQSVGRDQSGHYGGQQWPRKHQQRGDSGQTERQYQPREAISPSVPQERDDVWQKKQTSEKDDSRRDKSKVVGGAPDKVQTQAPTMSSNSPEQQMSKLSISPKPVTALVPVYKEPGTLARKIIKVESNHFALDLGKLTDAYHYDVTIEELDNKDKKKQPEKSQDKRQENVSRNRRIKDKVLFRVVQEFLRKHFPDRFPSFDGKKNLYASKPLTENLNDVFVDTDITVVDDFEKTKTFSITVKYSKTLSLDPQVQAGTFHPPMLAQDAIQCIDVVLRNAPIRYFNQIGASFFSKPTDRIIELGGGMEMYYGFYQSVVMGGRPLLNLHLVHKAFPKNMNVLDAFIEILTCKDKRNTYNYDSLTRLQNWQTKSLNEYIKSLKVAYVVPNFPKVIYRVNELVGSARQEKVIHNGTEKTVLEYYRTEKGYNILHPDLPLLWVGNPKSPIKIRIPTELCKIEKDQSVKRKMEEFQTTNMIKEAATDTYRHRNNTMKRFDEARYHESPCVQEFGFSVNNKFERMDARILPTPQLQYGGGKENVNKGTWQNKKFLIAKKINNWAIINLDRYVKRNDLVSFATQLKSASKNCGINIESDPVYGEVPTRSRFGPTKADLEQYFKSQKPNKFDIFFVVIPSSEQGSNIYSSVKTAAELSAGCLTQCITSRTISRLSFSTVTNILLKVNGKLDGVNHTFVTKPMLLQDRPVMIMGADVTHPGPTAGNIPSVAAIIASHDPTAFRYNSCFRLQDPKMEYIVDLKTVVEEHLMFYYNNNGGTKPEHIIFFRDGVSEGQFAEVLNIELTAIKKACKTIQRDGYDPTITFLVVQKRHHVRLFPVNEKDSEDQDFRRGDKTIKGNYNVPAGTCVDTTIVNPTMQNFYLVSHASIKGVSRPTKYCTLYDDLDLSNDQVEELAYYLCHMFARCNRSVSYPAPTYYAHLGALRGKAYIKLDLLENRFDMENLQREMAKIQIQNNIRKDNPMFFI